MIDWVTIKSELTGIVSDISELEPGAVKWRDQAEGGTWFKDPSVTMRVSSVSRVGIEEERSSQPTAESDLKIVVSGQRRFTFELRCESFEQDVSSPVFAGNVCDRIAIRLMRSTVQERLTSCAIETREPTKWFNFVSDGRQVATYVLDIQMLTVDNDIDKSIDAGGWIGEVHVASDTIDDVDEQPFSEQIDLVIPEVVAP